MADRAGCGRGVDQRAAVFWFIGLERFDQWASVLAFFVRNVTINNRNKIRGQASTASSMRVHSPSTRARRLLSSVSRLAKPRPRAKSKVA